VFVLSGQWDWAKRKLPGTDTFVDYGEQPFDAHVRSEYERAARALTARGASVVWSTTPCYELEAFAEDPRHANTAYVPAVDQALGEQVAVYDLFGQLCPNGAYSTELAGMTSVRPDGIHLSDQAADWVASTVMPTLVTTGRAT
jgi:hypothetical protein